MGAWRMFAYINEETVKAIVGWAYSQMAEAQADAIERFGEGTFLVDVSNIEVKVSDTYKGGNSFVRFVEGEEIEAAVFRVMKNGSPRLMQL